MSKLIENLNLIESYKLDIKSAIESKGVDMTNVSFPDYPAAIASISTAFVTETLSVTVNGTYYPSAGVDGFSEVSVNVPAPVPVTESLNVSVNGTYYPGLGYDGFNEVVVDVPQSVTGYTEKEITERRMNIVNLNNSASFVSHFAFYRYPDIETVSLSNCESVGESAFCSCGKLTTVNMPVCITVNNNAFISCPSLTTVSLPLCINISYAAFSGCFLLQSVDISECTIINGQGFRSCSSLEHISLPKCVQLEAGAFQDCKTLQSIDLPECRNINSSVFLNCYALSTVNLPKCSHISARTFENCSSLEHISIPMVESMDGFSTFRNTVISTVSLPRCEYLGGQVFAYCSLLSEIYVGMEAYGVPSISNNVFSYTPIASGTGSIYVRSDLYDQYIVANNWSVYASQIVSVPVSTSLLSFSNGALTGDTAYIKENIYSVLTIPSRYAILTVSLPECRSLYTKVFDNCQMLSEVSLPTCEYIDDFAFRNFGRSAASDIEITLPVCSYIGKAAFNQANKLTKLTLGSNSVCQLAKDTAAFYGSPVSIYVPASLYDAYLADAAWAFWSPQIFPIPE